MKYVFMIHYYQTHDLLWIYHAYTHNEDRTTTYVFHKLIR